jgi:hypothetical protein
MSGCAPVVCDKTDDRPLTTCERSLQTYGSSRSLYVNLPRVAADVLELTGSDDVRMIVHDDRVIIEVEDGDD